MFVAALAHAHAFPPRDYMDPSWQPRGFTHNIRVMFDVTDVMDDVQDVVDDNVNRTTATIGRVCGSVRILINSSSWPSADPCTALDMVLATPGVRPVYLLSLAAIWKLSRWGVSSGCRLGALLHFMFAFFGVALQQMDAKSSTTTV
jgi:hypothetical protein